MTGLERIRWSANIGSIWAGITRGELGKGAALALISAYRAIFSHLKLRPTCRFYPTCSMYAFLAISRYGIWKGTYLAARRIMRCHPFNPGGYDPVK